jgi:hypothetical protein
VLNGNENNENGGRGSTDNIDQVHVQIPVSSGQSEIAGERHKETEASEDPEEVENPSNQSSKEWSDRLDSYVPSDEYVPTLVLV